MALIEGTNSFCDVAYADAYAADRQGTDDFINLFEEDKERLLISASDLLDTFVWVGIATVSTQALSWPRDAEYYDPKVGDVVTLDNDTPNDIKDATVELAISFASSGSVTGSGGDSKVNAPDSIKVGSIELGGLNESSESNNVVIGGVQLPVMVANLINPYLGKTSNAGSGLFKPYFRAW